MARFTFQNEARQAKFEEDRRRKSELFQHTYYAAGFRTAGGEARSKYSPHQGAREIARRQRHAVRNMAPSF